MRHAKLEKINAKERFYLLVLPDMKRSGWIILLAIAGLWVLSACSPELRQYNTYTRKGSISEKDSAAFYFYKRGDYEKASILFEELQAAYRGSDRAKEIAYYYAQAKFKYGFYTVAAYYFEQYARLYPADPRTPECVYMVAESYYRESAPHYLDQTFTKKAINQFQLFMDTYPYVEQADEAQGRLYELRERLAKKDLEISRLYFNIGNYKAAVTSFKVTLEKFPDSRYREEAELFLFKSAVALAEQSTERRKKNRYLDAIDYYNRFIDRYPQSTYLKEAENLYIKAKRSLGKLNAANAG